MIKDLSLWESRRLEVARIISKLNIKSIADFGCGEGKLITYLVTYFSNKYESVNLKYILGVDLDKKEIEKCKSILEEIIKEYRNEYMSRTPIKLLKRKWNNNIRDFPNVRICCNDLLIENEFIKDKILENKVELITMVEVIEHLQCDQIEKLFNTLFHYYRVKHVLITTPNIEFNIYYQHFLLENGFRHWDHKFEWTRKEFREICNFYGTKYNYEVTFNGVGDFKENFGYPTQLALFTKFSEVNTSIDNSNSHSYYDINKVDNTHNYNSTNYLFNINYLIHKGEDKGTKIKNFVNCLYKIYEKIINRVDEETNYSKSDYNNIEKFFNFYIIRSSFKNNLNLFMRFLNRNKNVLRENGVIVNSKKLTINFKLS